MITLDFILEHNEIDLYCYLTAAAIYNMFPTNATKDDNKRIIAENCRGLPRKVRQNIEFVLKHGYKIAID